MSSDSLAAYFKFAERGTDLVTEARAGLTTFMVMAYIIFLNPAILSAAGIDVPAAAAATALVAGVMTIAMGIVGNYPLAMAAGLGINGVVAFTLVLGKGLTLPGAMGVIVLEGIVVTVLVVAGLREAIMNAVPLALKRSIGVGIGLFILFIGFVNGGFIVTPEGRRDARHRRVPDDDGQLRLPARPGDHHRAVRDEDPGGADHQHLRDHGHRAARGGPDDPERPRRDAQLRDARPVRRRQRVQPARPADGAAHDLRDHADRLLRHDGHGDRRRRRSRPVAPGRLGPGRRSRSAGRQHRRDRRWRRRDQLEHDLHRERRGRGRGRPDRVRLGHHRRPLPARDLPVADRWRDPVRRHGAGPRARRLSHVHARQGHQRSRTWRTGSPPS